MPLQIGEIFHVRKFQIQRNFFVHRFRYRKGTSDSFGIKSYYSPEEMVGKKVVVITNLKPAKLAGVLSEGMLLCAEDDEGRLALLTADKDMPAGSMIS